MDTAAQRRIFRSGGRTQRPPPESVKSMVLGLRV